MDITFTWSVEKVTVTADASLVTNVYWRCDAADDLLTAAAAGIRNLVASDSFVPFEQLTEQQVLDWCFAPELITLDDQTTITKLLKDDVEAQVTAQIASQLVKKTSEPALPWIPVVTEL
jgi:hypothetical protein